MAETANRRVRYYDLNGNGPFVSDAMTETEAGVFALAHVGAEIESADEVQPDPQAVFSAESAPPVQTGETVYAPGIAEPAPVDAFTPPVQTVPGPATRPAEGGAEVATPASVQPTGPGTPLFESLRQPGEPQH